MKQILFELEKIQAQSVLFLRSNHENIHSVALAFFDDLKSSQNDNDSNQDQADENDDEDEEDQPKVFHFVQDVLNQTKDRRKTRQQKEEEAEEEEDFEILDSELEKPDPTSLQILEIQVENREKIENAKEFGEFMTLLEDICKVYRLEFVLFLIHS